MATKTGNSYTAGTTTDSVEIPTASPGFSTMASPNKVSPGDSDNDRQSVTLVNWRLQIAEYRCTEDNIFSGGRERQIQRAPPPPAPRSAPLVFSDSRSPLRSAYLTFWPASLRFSLCSRSAPILWLQCVHRNVHTNFLPLDARNEKRGIAIVSRPSVCLSVSPSVTLTYRAAYVALLRKPAISLKRPGQDRTKITIDEVAYALSIGVKINDRDWPWRAITHCFKTHASFGDHHENLNEDRL